MLPAPVSFRAGRARGLLTVPGPTSSSAVPLRELLRAPARITNLAALTLLCVAIVSIYLNLHLWASSSVGTGSGAWPRTSGSLPPSIAATLERPVQRRLLDHLVIVPGHGIWTGAEEEDILDEKYWLLAEFQRNRGRPAVFLEHIRRAVNIANKDPRALLVFSGGQTSPASTTEAQSYARLAQIGGLIANPNSIFTFMGLPVESTTELFALDSFQNLLFSIARFREYTGHYPTNITVVGYAFKGKRFEELHARALRWPVNRLTYIGVELDDKADEAQAAQGELENSFRPFTTDLYGCWGPLTAKRLSRNPHLRAHPYHASAPEIAKLIEWCPSDGTAVYPGPLPWAML
ncbi:hypothetical protein PENSPDRAFT_752015 [Peniophora sp. CONT]|nr:hypothetical protein PENSPDRAFT_752015 [Peniophora sp. CONT]